MQCAAIPYRITQAGKFEVLLVTSRRKRHWIVPKGKMKPGISAATSAAEEAYEEAGAKGKLNQAMIASFDVGELVTVSKVGLTAFAEKRVVPTGCRVTDTTQPVGEN